jgi:hypothetical protein
VIGGPSEKMKIIKYSPEIFGNGKDTTVATSLKITKKK